MRCISCSAKITRHILVKAMQKNNETTAYPHEIYISNVTRLKTDQFGFLAGSDKEFTLNCSKKHTYSYYLDHDEKKKKFFLVVSYSSLMTRERGGKR